MLKGPDGLSRHACGPRSSQPDPALKVTPPLLPFTIPPTIYFPSHNRLPDLQARKCPLLVLYPELKMSSHAMLYQPAQTRRIPAPQKPISSGDAFSPLSIQLASPPVFSRRPPLPVTPTFTKRTYNPFYLQQIFSRLLFPARQFEDASPRPALLPLLQIHRPHRVRHPDPLSPQPPHHPPSHLVAHALLVGYLRHLKAQREPVPVVRESRVEPHRGRSEERRVGKE